MVLESRSLSGESGDLLRRSSRADFLLADLLSLSSSRSLDDLSPDSRERDRRSLDRRSSLVFGSGNRVGLL